MGLVVGAVEGDSDGLPGGTLLGVDVGPVLEAIEGDSDGLPDATLLGAKICVTLGTFLGEVVGFAVVGRIEGVEDGIRLGVNGDGRVDRVQVGAVEGPEGSNVGIAVGSERKYMKTNPFVQFLV